MPLLEPVAGKSDSEARKAPNLAVATLLIAATYFAFAWLTLQLALPVGYMPAIFFAAGIAVSAAFIMGPRALIGVAIGSLSFNIWLSHSSGAPLLSPQCIASVLAAAANIVQAAVGGWMLRRVLGYPCPLDRTREILLLLLLTPLFCLISASLLAPTLFALGLYDRIRVLQSWLIFWLGDTMGVLLILPLVLTLVGEPRAIWRRRRVIVAVPMLIVAALFIFAFTQAVRWEEMESLNYLRTQVGWQSWSFLIFGLFVTGLLGAFLLLSSGHTARVEMEVEHKVRELHESTEKLRTLFELSPLGIALADTHDHYVAVNEAFAKITGYTTEELKKIDYSLLVPPEHRADSKAHYTKALKYNRYGPHERECLRKDGTLVPVNVNGMLVTGSDGEKYFWSITEDISERKRAERALRDSEERWQFALEGSGDGVWDIDLAKGEMFFSPQAMAMLGYEYQARRMMSSEWKAFVHPEDIERGKAILAKCIEDKAGFYVFDFRSRTKDGQWRWLRRRGKLIGNLPSGLPARMIGTHTDIHYEKHQKQKEHLHSVVMEMLARDQGMAKVLQTMTEVLHRVDSDLIYVALVERKKHLSMIATNRFLAELKGRKFPLSAQPTSGGAAIRDGEIIKMPMHNDALWLSCAVFAAEVGIALCWIELIAGKAGEIKGALVAFNCVSASTTLPDIDHLKQAAGLMDAVMQHNEMEEQTQLIASVYEASSEGIMVTDGEGRILAINPAFTAITGYSAEDVIGHANEILRTITLGEGSGPYSQAQVSIIKTGHWKGEFLGHRKNGEALPTGITINTIWDVDGNAVRRVCIFSDITEKKLSEERMQYLATHDSLTALPNRLLFQDRLQQALAIAQRENSQLALLYIDLDHFKPVNDTLGHSIGDHLLTFVAIRIQACVRESDTVARMGGDEFVVLLPTIKSPADTLVVAEKIKQMLNETFEISGNFINISASLGVAIYPDDGADENALSQHADMAMYRAKQQGKNRVETYRGTAPPSA